MKPKAGSYSIHARSPCLSVDLIKIAEGSEGRGNKKKKKKKHSREQARKLTADVSSDNLTTLIAHTT